MQCPVCNRTMAQGHITGTHLPRLIPGIPAGNAHRITEEEIHQLIPGFTDGSRVLEVYYTGLAPWIPAEYCPDCGKVVCQLNILNPRKEEET